MLGYLTLTITCLHTNKRSSGSVQLVEMGDESIYFAAYMIW